MRGRRADVEAKRYGDLKLGRHAAGPGTLPQKRYGGTLQVCRHGDVCLKSSGGMLRARDVEV